jgi:hypothetical protein
LALPQEPWNLLLQGGEEVVGEEEVVVVEKQVY